MAAMNLRSLDLNLLLVFEAILREGSVARAAERLHLSQPATSHALSRLRHRLKDQLFVRTPMGMSPTPRAERLARPVRRALDELQLALEPDVFSPATAERIFVVALNNFGAIALAAPVVSECLKQAPRIRVSLRPSGTLDVLNFLERRTRPRDLRARRAGRSLRSPRLWSSITMSSSCGAATRRRSSLWISRALPNCRGSSCPPREACEPARGHRLERRSRSSFV